MNPNADFPFAELLQTRHSTRRFTDTPLADGLLETLLAEARRAPSGANLQPGSFVRVDGAARTRLSAALTQAFRNGQAQPEEYSYFPQPLPLSLRKRQVAAARALYGALDTAREDRAGRERHFERNFTFFDAPVALIVTIDARMGSGCFMDLGMCLYGLMLAAAARGLGTCGIGALASYSGLIRSTLDLPAGELIVCGLALGHPDHAAAENTVRTERLVTSDYFRVIS